MCTLFQRIVSLSFLYLFARSLRLFFFFFNDTATTEIYTLSLHDALPISFRLRKELYQVAAASRDAPAKAIRHHGRSEEHTSELQSHLNLVCRLLLEKKKRRCQRRARWSGGYSSQRRRKA